MAIKLDRTKLIRNMAAKHKLVTHLDQEIGKGDFEWEYKYEPKKHDDAWHPSGDCTPSLNELYWKVKAPEERDFGPALLKTFQVGHFWHQYLQYIVAERLELCAPEAIERTGKLVWAEEKGKPLPYHWATGSGDIAPCDIPGHGEYIVDFKTMGTHDYRRQDMPAWCADKYECQINIYMDFFDLDKGMIVAILKDSPHDMKEWVYERNQPLIDAIHRKWKLVSACLEAGIEPPIDEVHQLPVQGPVQQ